MGSLSKMTTIPKINAPEARDSYVCRIAFFLKYHLLHQDNFLSYLLCLVTYVTAFSLILVSNFQICDSLLFSKAFQKCKMSTSTVSSIFIYFSSIIDIKIGYVNLGVVLLAS